MIFCSKKGVEINLIEEQRLLANLKKGKRDSLEKVIELYTPYVNVITYNIIGSMMTKEDIEEVISDVFISLWKHAATLDQNKGTIRAYLGATARNCAKNKLREFEPHVELDEQIVSRTAVFDTALEQKEDQKLLLDMIVALGEPDSEIFLRYYYYNERIKKISHCVGLCQATVKTKLARGRMKLKEVIMQKRGGAG